MPDDEKRVVTTMPLEIDRVVRPAGTDLTLSAADADALVEARRAEFPKAEEPKPTDEVAGPAPAEEAHAAPASETPAEEH